MRTRRIIHTLLCLLLPVLVSAQVAYDPVAPAHKRAKAILTEICDDIYADDVDETLSGRTLTIARAMLGTPYEAGTLEGETEELRVYLDRTDCMLFVESCVAIALTSFGKVISYGTGLRAVPYGGMELFLRNILSLRYRCTVPERLPDVRYDTRLHYASEWMLQAEDNGILRELSPKLGVQRAQKFNYMSSHPALYPQLKDNMENQRLIREAEQRLEGRGPFYYIPQDRIEPLVESGDIRDGDIIAFVSNTAGLDVTHLGIACTVDGKMHFIHASSAAGKVIVEPKTLSAYAKNGIRIFRLS